MNPEIMAVKREVRQTIRALLKRLTSAEKARASEEARRLLSQQQEWREARSILFYTALPDEVDLAPLLEAGLREGKSIALPRYASDRELYDVRRVSAPGECVVGKFGIVEPSSQCPPFPLNQLDLALVPGVGFDPFGHRLGRGQGYYDRLLAEINGIKCGVGFDQQLVEHIPREAHDILMNVLLTPTRWRKIS